MFCFCCPKKKGKTSTNSIDEKLIQVNDSPRREIPSSKRLALSQSDKKKQSLSISQNSLPFSYTQKSNNLNLNSHHRSQYFQQQNFGIKPRFQILEEKNKESDTPHGSKLMKGKSQIYEFEHNTEIIYFDTKKEDEFCVRYLINKKPNLVRQSKSILNYVLSRKSSSQNTQLVLIIPSQTMYETKYLHIPPNIHTVFTNMRRLQKHPSSSNSSQIIEIVDAEYGSIKTDPFDKIILMLEGQNDLNYIKKFSRQLCNRYSLEQFMKIWWVFPAFLTLQDITDILKQTLRKFIINDKIINIAFYLHYEIELVKQLNFQPFLLVKNKKWKQFTRPNTQKDTKKIQTDYQTQICLAMGLLTVQMNQVVMPVYKYFMENVLFEMKLLDYLKYKGLLQNERENFFKRLVFYNLLTDEGVKALEQNRKIIQHKYQNPDHRRFSIKHSSKKKFIAAFGFQDSVQTGQGNTPIEKQWDDQLRLQDLKTRKGSWQGKQPSDTDNDLNLIDEEDIQNIIVEELMIEDSQDGSRKFIIQNTKQPLMDSTNRQNALQEMQIQIQQTEQQ